MEQEKARMNQDSIFRYFFSVTSDTKRGFHSGMDRGYKRTVTWVQCTQILMAKISDEIWLKMVSSVQLKKHCIKFYSDGFGIGKLAYTWVGGILCSIFKMPSVQSMATRNLAA